MPLFQGWTSSIVNQENYDVEKPLVDRADERGRLVGRQEVLE